MPSLRQCFLEAVVVRIPVLIVNRQPAACPVGQVCAVCTQAEIRSHSLPLRFARPRIRASKEGKGFVKLLIISAGYILPRSIGSFASKPVILLLQFQISSVADVGAADLIGNCSAAACISADRYGNLLIFFGYGHCPYCLIY